jgi:hypothetical protein
MSLWDRFKERRERRRVVDEDVKLKLVRNALARAFDEEAERLNEGRPIEYGTMKPAVSQATREAQDLGSYVRKLQPRDPRIEEALLFQEAGLLTPLDDRAREVLAQPWPGGFDAEAKLDAAMKALHESLESRESR